MSTPKNIHIEIFKSLKNHQWYFRIKSSNGRILASSEGYKQKASAYKGANLIASYNMFMYMEEV